MMLPRRPTSPVAGLWVDADRPTFAIGYGAPYGFASGAKMVPPPPSSSPRSLLEDADAHPRGRGSIASERAERRMAEERAGVIEATYTYAYEVRRLATSLRPAARAEDAEIILAPSLLLRAPGSWMDQRLWIEQRPVQRQRLRA